MKSYTGPKMVLVKRLGGVPRRATRGSDDLYTVVVTDAGGNRVPLARGGIGADVIRGASRGEAAWCAAYNAVCAPDTVITVAVERM